MADYGWMINLTGETIPVYASNGSVPSDTQLGKLYAGECFVDGTISENPWEGDGTPVVFLTSSHEMKFGCKTPFGFLSSTYSRKFLILLHEF